MSRSALALPAQASRGGWAFNPGRLACPSASGGPGRRRPSLFCRRRVRLVALRRPPGAAGLSTRGGLPALPLPVRQAVCALLSFAGGGFASLPCAGLPGRLGFQPGAAYLPFRLRRARPAAPLTVLQAAGSPRCLVQASRGGWAFNPGRLVCPSASGGPGRRRPSLFCRWRAPPPSQASRAKTRGPRCRAPPCLVLIKDKETVCALCAVFNGLFGRHSFIFRALRFLFAKCGRFVLYSWQAWASGRSRCMSR